MKSTTQTLALDQICIDGGTQPRVAINKRVVAEYADFYRDKIKLPPVVVFFDGAKYWLADGFHRYWARKRNECQDILADVCEGTQRDAILFSVGTNTKHGLHRKKADKRKAVLTLLEDVEWSQWSNREIASQCSVNEKTVRRARGSLTAAKPQLEQQPRTYKTRHGTIARMKTGNINRSRRKIQKPRSPSEFLEARQNGYRGRPTSMVKLELPNNHVHNCAYDLLRFFTFEYLQKVFQEVVNIQKERAQKEESE